MELIRKQINHIFVLISRVAYRHRIKTILAVLLLSLPLFAQLPKITLDTTNESFFQKDDRTLLDYNAFRDQFGKDEMFVIGITAPKIFNLEFLNKLKALHDELAANLPYLDDITSLVNARNTRGEGDTLIVEDLMKKWPVSDTDLATLKERVLANSFYRDNLISADGKFTAILVKAMTYVPEEEDSIMAGFNGDDASSSPTKEKRYLSNEQSAIILEAMRPILAKYEGPDFSIHLAGLPVVVDALDRGIRKDMERLTPLSILVIIVLLFIMFRRISGVIYPILTVILSLLSTMGLMAAMGIPISNITQILPTFMIVVGISDSVHILSIFYQKFRENGDKEKSIVYAFGNSGLAILMTTMTTALGLASFVVADVAPIADLGIVAPLGVLLAMLYTIFLLPALISLFPIKKTKIKQLTKASMMDRIIDYTAAIPCRHPGKIIFITLLIVALSVGGITQLKLSHNGLKWLPETSSVRLDTDLLDEVFNGTITLEVVLDTGKENGLYDPDFLNRLENSVQYVEGISKDDIFVGKAYTLTTILKEINRALNENRSEYYIVPKNRNLVAQEFLLFENTGSDDLEEIVDAKFRKVRFTIKAPFRDAVQYKWLIATVNEHFTQTYPDAKISITGIMAMFAEIVDNVISTMIDSYLIALALITLLMMLLIGRVRIGMLSMVPNLVPIIAILGFMGWVGIPIDLATVLVGSVAIGLVVDDTIHFMHHFRSHLDQTGSAEMAVKLTLSTTGRAMLVTSIVLSCGFFINMLSVTNSTYNFGLLTGVTVLLALIADFFLGPALMIIANKHKPK